MSLSLNYRMSRETWKLTLFFLFALGEILTLSGCISGTRKWFMTAIVSLFLPAWKIRDVIYLKLNSNEGMFWKYVFTPFQAITCATARLKAIHSSFVTLLIPDYVFHSYRKWSILLWPASCVCASFLLPSCHLSSSTWGRNTPMPAPAALFCSWLK